MSMKISQVCAELDVGGLAETSLPHMHLELPLRSEVLRLSVMRMFTPSYRSAYAMTSQRSDGNY